METFHVLQIQAADNGQPSLMSTTKVILTVVDVPKPGLSKSANQPPEFSTAGLTITQMESDNVGDMVCLMSATDADGDKIWFFIDGEPIIFFEICVPDIKGIAGRCLH